MAQLELSYVDSLAPNRGDLLDIGCGAGEFVAAAAASGWRATGIDPALPTTLKACPARLIRGSFAELGDERFDVVTLWDVIEHFDNPRSLLSAARDHLRPGGLLVVETGNYQSVGRIEAGREWWGYQHDHRWYFAPPTLFRLLAAAGFAEPKLHNHVLRPWWKGKARYDGPSALSHLKAAIRAPHQAGDALKRYRGLSRAAGWTDWAGLEIVTISAKAA
jgi:SAM-dependent methyltransferase